MKSNNSYDILVIGAGAAGIAAIQGAIDHAAQTNSEKLTLAMVTEENRLPYKRTKISKTVANGFATDEFAVKDREWYEANAVSLFVGRRVVSLDPEQRSARLDDGSLLVWRKLILATGAEPRLPESVDAAAENVFCTHNATDIEDLRAWATAHPEQRGIILGGGVLGIEVAWELHQMGMAAAVVGSASRLLPRELDEESSAELLQLCRSAGVEVYLGEGDYRLRDTDEGFSLSLPVAGQTIEGGFLVLAAGLAPRLDVAREAGLEINRAVLVDEHLKTSADDIYAAGDCCEHPDGRVTHLWRDALRQGEVAGANATAELLHAEPELTAYRYLPFRLKCEVFGRYFFSLCRPPEAAAAELPAPESRPPETQLPGKRFDTVVYRTGGRYVRAFFRPTAGNPRRGESAPGLIQGVVMVGDKENQERYMLAVHEGWSRERFETEFSLT